MKTLAENTKEIIEKKRTCVKIENVLDFLGICKFLKIVVLGGALTNDFTAQWFYV